MRNRKNDASEILPVDWAKNIAEATQDAKKEDVPFLVFFCSEESAAIAGLGSRAIEKHSKSTPKLPPYTVFEADVVVETLDAAELPIVKIVASPQNADLAKKYKVNAAPALVACEPEGTVIASLQAEQVTQANVLEMLKSLKETYARWKNANTEKATPKTAEPAAPAKQHEKRKLPDDAP